MCVINFDYVGVFNLSFCEFFLQQRKILDNIIILVKANNNVNTKYYGIYFLLFLLLD